MPDGTTETQAQEATTTTTTQEPGSRGIDAFPEEAQDYIRRLRQENAGHRNDRKDLEQRLKAFEDQNKSDQEKLEERATTAESGLSAAGLKLLRYEVAAEHDLPLKYAGRLQGSTKEELAADAVQLVKDFGLAGESTTPGGFDGGVRRPVQKPSSMNGFIRHAAGR